MERLPVMDGSPRSGMLMGIPSRTTDVKGIATSVLDVGDGPPLVLLHGGIECGGSMWAPVIGALAERHRVVVPDVPGLGESAPTRRLDADSFGPWLRALMTAMHVDRPAVVAHSLVGGLAARFAIAERDAIDRLVLYATPSVAAYRMPLRLRYVALRFAIRPNRPNAERFERFALFDLDSTRARDAAWFSAFESYNLAQARRPHVKRTMRQLIMQTKAIPDAELDRLGNSTTLLWGRHDRMVPVTVAGAAKARHGWPLHIIEDAAHVPHIEQPSAFVDAVNAIVGGASRSTRDRPDLSTRR